MSLEAVQLKEFTNLENFQIKFPLTLYICGCAQSNQMYIRIGGRMLYGQGARGTCVKKGSVYIYRIFLNQIYSVESNTHSANTIQC